MIAGGSGREPLFCKVPMDVTSAGLPWIAAAPGHELLDALQLPPPGRLAALGPVLVERVVNVPGDHFIDPR